MEMDGISETTKTQKMQIKDEKKWKKIGKSMAKAKIFALAIHFDMIFHETYDYGRIQYSACD